MSITNGYVVSCPTLPAVEGVYERQGQTYRLGHTQYMMAQLSTKEWGIGDGRTYLLLAQQPANSPHLVTNWTILRDNSYYPVHFPVSIKPYFGNPKAPEVRQQRSAIPVDLPTIKSDTEFIAELEEEFNVINEQVTKAPLRKDAVQKRDELQTKFDAAKADGTDFALIGSLGQSVQAHKTYLAQLSLSEEDYVTLATRHTALVQKMEAKCKELLQAERFDLLTSLGAKLNALKALDLSAVPDPSDMDPVYVEPTCDRAIGPTLVLGPVAPACKPVVICIHFGAAYSGIAYAFASDPETIRYGAPTALDPTQMKVPTALLQLPNGQWEFGYAAEAAYNQILQDLDTSKPITNPDQMPGHLYRRFKMALKGQTAGFDTLTAPSMAGKPHSLMDLVVRSLDFLKKYAMDEVSKRFGAAVVPDRDVQWVLTVPAIWNDFGKAFMRKAAFKAGLITYEQSDSLMLVLEPECASLAVHVDAAQYSLLGVGSRFMVLDCGGGTIDITSYDVTSIAPLQMKAITAPCGGDWGGDYVNVEFKTFLKDFLGGELFEELEDPSLFYSINAEFDKVKMMFDPNTDPNTDPNNIRLKDVLDKPGDLVGLADKWNAKHPEKPILKNSPVLRNGYLPMSKELMLSFFEPFLKKTVDDTRRVMGEIPGVRYIMVVGGFGSSKVLTTRIRDEFHNKRGVTVILPDPRPKPQIAAMSGAVLFGLHKDIIQCRLAAYTYGNCRTISGVPDCFSAWVRKGQQLPYNQCFETEAMPESDAETTIILRVYRSDKEDPQTVVGEHLLGTIPIPCPPNSDVLKRKVKVVVKFTGSEICVTAVNGEGKEIRGCIAML